MKIQPPKGCRHRAGDFNVREHTHTLEKTMKIKSNVRAGSQTQTQTQSRTQSSKSLANVVITYVASVSRCVGI